MGINSRIAKIPFIILYLILAAFPSFNWSRVILFQKNWEAFRTQQPWDYYLSNFFSNTFGITHQQYFILALPVMLIGLYLIPKIVGKLLNLDKNTNIKGDNHVAIIAILLIAPTALGRGYLIPGIIIILLFSVWSWIDEKQHKG